MLDYQNINMPREVLTIVGEDYQDIYKANKINWQKGSTCKTDEAAHENEPRPAVPSCHGRR